MLKFEGERILAGSPEQLWPRLRDVGFLAGSIEGATRHDGATRDHAVCTVHPGLAFMRGSLEVTMQILDQQEPTTLRYSLKSKGIGSTSEVETALKLMPHEQGTQIHWTAEVKSLGGLLKMVPQGLIRGAANKVIEEVWTGLGSKLQN